MMLAGRWTALQRSTLAVAALLLAAENGFTVGFGGGHEPVDLAAMVRLTHFRSPSSPTAAAAESSAAELFRDVPERARPAFVVLVGLVAVTAFGGYGRTLRGLSGAVKEWQVRAGERAGQEGPRIVPFRRRQARGPGT